MVGNVRNRRSETILEALIHEVSGERENDPKAPEHEREFVVLLTFESRRIELPRQRVQTQTTVEQGEAPAGDGNDAGRERWTRWGRRKN